MGLIRVLITAYRSSFAGIPREVWLLSGALLVNRAGTMVLPLSPALKKRVILAL